MDNPNPKNGSLVKILKLTPCYLDGYFLNNNPKIGKKIFEFLEKDTIGVLIKNKGFYSPVLVDDKEIVYFDINQLYPIFYKSLKEGDKFFFKKKETFYYFNYPKPTNTTLCYYWDRQHKTSHIWKRVNYSVAIDIYPDDELTFISYYASSVYRPRISFIHKGRILKGSIKHIDYVKFNLSSTKENLVATDLPQSH